MSSPFPENNFTEYQHVRSPQFSIMQNNYYYASFTRKGIERNG